MTLAPCPDFKLGIILTPPASVNGK
jgi:hypothetical protein